MEKIEEVTCIKFEDRSRNNHTELVQYIVTDKERLPTGLTFGLCESESHMKYKQDYQFSVIMVP